MSIIHALEEWEWGVIGGDTKMKRRRGIHGRGSKRESAETQVRGRSLQD